MSGLRDVDRRVAARAWQGVRRPVLPAWLWLAMDVFVASLVVAAGAGLVSLRSDDAGNLVRALGLPTIVAVAIFNFVRTTRPRD